MIGVNYLELCPAQLARIVEWWQRENDENVRVSFAGAVGTQAPNEAWQLTGLRFELRPAVAGLLEHLPSPARVEWTSGDVDHPHGYRAQCRPCGWSGWPTQDRSVATRQATEHRCAR